MSTGGRIEAQMTVPSGVSFTATNSGGGPTTITITAGTYYITALAAHVAVQLNALRTPANWTCSVSTGIQSVDGTLGTGKTSINYTGSGTYSIAWTASGATLKAILGYTADIILVAATVPAVSTNQARGLWIPDCPLAIDGDPKRAPMGSDARATVSPDGEAYGLVGTTFYRHRNLRYSHVARARVWEVEAATTNASWETFFKETQLGQSSSWFTPLSKCNIYFDNAGIDTLVGNDKPIAGWKFPKPKSLDDLALASGTWPGLVRVELGDITSRG